MVDFAIKAGRTPSTGPDDPHPLSIRAGEVVFTRLLRPGREQADDFLLAPPASLAFWLIDNWWRLRWECLPPKNRVADWRLAHELASIGGGYVWPRLAIWSEGARIGLSSKSDPPGVVEPVRYVTDALIFLDGASFEAAVDVFLKAALDARTGFGSDRDALRAQWEALQSERQDKEVASWRRLEAQAGYDPDCAPEKLIHDLGGLADEYGRAGVEEAVQAFPGKKSATVLKEEIVEAKSSKSICFDFTTIVKSVSGWELRQALPPWQLAQEAAELVRTSLAISPGKVTNGPLSDLVGANLSTIFNPTLPPDAPYGLRIKSQNEQYDKVALRARGTASRRFEVCCAVGDAIWARGDILGPIAPHSKTARQKFQRAFAQNLLCPSQDLLSYISKTSPSDDDIEAASEHFHVTEGVIRTILRNKGLLPIESFEDKVEAEQSALKAA